MEREKADDVIVAAIWKVPPLTHETSLLEAALSEDGYYRLLVDTIDEYAIYLIDREGRVSSWNAGAKRFKGYDAAEVLGQNFSRFYTEEDRAAGLPQRALETAAREGRFESEGWRVRKDGTHFWAHAIIDPIIKDGELVGYAKITRDLTERRETRLALEAAREQLVQAQKMEAVGQLTGGVAHDFNNLLTAVLSSLELLRKAVPDDPKVLKLIDSAVQGARRGATLTQRMLAFARRQPLKSEAVDVDKLVHGLVDLLVPSLGPGAKIKVDIPKDLPRVITDASQLETAIINLCVNAHDAMPHGGVIGITAQREELGTDNALKLAAGSYIKLSVADEGVGMDAETLARATEPFFTTKGVGKGTGLGLSMVHGLAAQSNGRLMLKSNFGRGTTAELWLPAGAADFLTPEPVQQPERTLDRPLSILTVDDDALVLMNTTMMLEDLGHQVHEALSGKEALEILHSGAHFDLVVSDHAMPGMTGSQLARAIGAEWPALPVILATGYAELPPGSADDLPRLSKPFSQKDLARAVAQAVLH